MREGAGRGRRRRPSPIREPPSARRQTLVATFKDWRYFLDLLEQVGGSTQAPELFKTWVVSDVERPLLRRP